MQNNPQDTNRKNKIMIIVLIVLCVIAVATLIAFIAAVAGATNKNDDGRKSAISVSKNDEDLITVYNPKTGQVKQIHMEVLSEYEQIGWTTKKPVKTDGPNYDGSIVLYRPNGETIKIQPEDAEEYLSVADEDERWYEEPVMYVYKAVSVNSDAEDGRKIIKESELEDHIKAVNVDDDGKTTDIPKEDRWYTSPVVLLYKPMGRTEVVADNEESIEQYVQLGWSKEPVAAIRKGELTEICLLTELESKKAQGWEEYDPERKPCEYCSTMEHLSEEHPRCAYCNSTSHTTSKHNKIKCSVCGSTSHTVHPKCSVCGSTSHTVHPKCSVCGSTSHTVHPQPKCSYCGSTAHTVHPVCAKCGSYDHTTDNPPYTCSYCGGHHRPSEHDAIVAREAAAAREAEEAE